MIGCPKQNVSGCGLRCINCLRITAIFIHGAQFSEAQFVPD